MRLSRQLAAADRKLARNTAKVDAHRAGAREPLPGFGQRMNALWPLSQPGPRYIEAVAAAWTAADSAYRAGRMRDASRWLAAAEQTANRELGLA